MPKLGMYEDDVELVEWVVDRRQHGRGRRPAVHDGDREDRRPRSRPTTPGSSCCVAEPGFRAPIGTRIGYLVSTEAEQAELRAELAARRMIERRAARRRRCARCCASGSSRSGCAASSARATCRASCTPTSAPRRWPSACAPTCGDADLITSTHRGHGHCLAKGVDDRADRRRAVRPGDRAVQGPRRVDARRRLLEGDARRQRHRRRRDLAGRGRGARRPDVSATAGSPSRSSATAPSNQGIFHESLNLAAIWRLPVVFVCENNGWAESTPSSYAISVENVAVRGRSPTACLASPSTPPTSTP